MVYHLFVRQYSDLLMFSNGAKINSCLSLSSVAYLSFTILLQSYLFVSRFVFSDNFPVLMFKLKKLKIMDGAPW